LIALIEKPDVMEAFMKAQMEPLSGWPWLAENKLKRYPEQSIAISYDGKAILCITSTRTRPSLIKTAMTMARNTETKERGRLEHARKTV
jgi:hypothetical protein